MSKKKKKKYNRAVADNSTIVMVVKHITMSLASHWFIVTGHGVVTYLNTLSNYARMYVIIRFNIICVAFSNEAVISVTFAAFAGMICCISLLLTLLLLLLLALDYYSIQFNNVALKLYFRQYPAIHTNYS